MKTSFTEQTVEFAQLVLGFSSAALHYLGQAPSGESKEVPRETNLALARQNIEIIRMLKTKTTGNLTGEEVKLIDAVLTDLMMKYHEASKNPG